MDVEVKTSTSFTWPVILQALAMLGVMAAIYASMVSTDKELSTRLAQVTDDVRRVEREAKDLRSDIRADLGEIKSELRELRTAVSQRGPK